MVLVCGQNVKPMQQVNYLLCLLSFLTISYIFFAHLTSSYIFFAHIKVKWIHASCCEK